MVVALNVEHDIDRATRRLNLLEHRHVPFAISLALTLTAKDAAKTINRFTTKAFDRPIGATKKAVTWEPAIKKTGTLSAVHLKDSFIGGPPIEKYLKAQVEGGPRRHKRFERALISSGHMPSNKYAVPAKNLRLNRFGNVPASTHVKILSSIKSGIDPTQFATGSARSNRQQQNNQFFSLPKGRGKLPAGIWQRKGTGPNSFITLIFAYVSRPRYRRRLPFDKIAERVSRRRFPINMRKALKFALKTAR